MQRLVPRKCRFRNTAAHTAVVHFVGRGRGLVFKGGTWSDCKMADDDGDDVAFRDYMYGPEPRELKHERWLRFLENKYVAWCVCAR